MGCRESKQTNRKQIVLDQTASLGTVLFLQKQSDLGLFCLHMLFLSELFGSGIQRVQLQNDAYLKLPIFISTCHWQCGRV